ncbi:hypothetical protein Y032_0653g1177 [Ancylostoma ceylanicum]|uniref:Uncharacterized protein n=1 Tax=Ancylostoma ceylanicum TaxID=53326 RepID=A0A016WIQ1_9BILA|nr:hypothetical protein Y032_0653g1177 [Ancylostoma ceylanicum]
MVRALSSGKAIKFVGLATKQTYHGSGQKEDQNSGGSTHCTPTSSWLGSIPTRRTTGQYGIKGSAKRNGKTLRKKK